MTFAHPYALLGLLLLPIIVAFYLWRAQHQRQVVSSTWLWREVQARFSHRPSRRLPLREPLLLLQLLASLALILLLSDPAISHAARLHRIVILDGSITMAATDVRPSRWDEAKQRVLALLDARSTDEQFSLILAGPQARLIGTVPGDVNLAKLVENLPAPVGSPDLAGAVALARGISSSTGGEASSVLFLASAQTATLQIPELQSSSERFGGTLDDQGITTLTTRCLPSGTCQAFARIRNTANAPRTDTLAVWADNQLLGQQALHIPAAGSLDLDFAIPPGARALHAALLQHDQLDADNIAWALTPAPEPRKVLLVSDTPGQLLPALQAVPGLSVQVSTTSAYEDALAVGKDLVVMDKILPDILPPNPVLAINPPGDATLLHTRASARFLPITQIAQSDPAVAGLDLYHLAITGSALEVPSWASVGAGGANGPAVLDGTLEGQRIVVLPWDVGHSVAAQDPIFPLLIERLVRWLAPSLPPSLPLGAAVTLPAGVLSLQSPSGTVLMGPLITLAQAGIYRVDETIGTRTTGDPLFVVSAVSDTAPDTVTAAAPAWVLPTASRSMLQTLWPLAVSLALLALSAEWLFYTRKT